MSALSTFLATFSGLVLLFGFEPVRAQGFTGQNTTNLLQVPKLPPGKEPKPAPVSVPAALPKSAPVSAAPAKGPEPCPQQPRLFNDRQDQGLREAIGIVDPTSFLIPPDEPDTFGICHPYDSSKMWEDAKNAQAKWLRMGGPYVIERGEKVPKFTKAVPVGRGANEWTEANATTADFMAYDILMRTLAAEVGWTFCAEASQMAVAKLILNRIDEYLNRKPGASSIKSMDELIENSKLPDQGKASLTKMDNENRVGLDKLATEVAGVAPIKPQPTGLEQFKDKHPIVRVVVDRRKFSAWWDQSDSYKTATCPQNIRDPNQLRKIARIAAKAIFHQDRFSQQTHGVTSNDYTSEDWMRWVRPCQGYAKLTNQTVIDDEGKEIHVTGKKKCVDFWRAPKKPKECDLAALAVQYEKVTGKKPPHIR